MGVYAHATHLYLPDKDQARLVAGALLKSPHSLLIAKPYGNWLNVYLEIGLSYKDVPEFPTCSYIELNCYNSEGIDLRLYHQDRLAFLFENGVGDAADDEDQLLEIASNLWKEDPDRPTAEKPEVAEAEGENEEEKSEVAEELKKKEPSFWDLSAEQQEPYLAKAKESADFKKYQETSESDVQLPTTNPFRPFISDERTDQEFFHLLKAIHHRGGGELHGAIGETVAKFMDGKKSSEKGEDYIKALQEYFGLKGSLWNLESIQEARSDAVKGRVVDTTALDNAPPTDQGDS